MKETTEMTTIQSPGKKAIADGGPVLEVLDLSVFFRRAGQWNSVVRHITFSLSKGETLAIVGESG